MRKLLTGTNLTNKLHGMQRGKIVNHGALVAMIRNFRKFIYELGYDASLLDDSEVLAFEDLIHEAEQTGDNDFLTDALDFNSADIEIKNPKPEPDKELGSFAAMAQGKTDYIVDVMHIKTSDYGDLMAIAATEECVYITRTQAAKFFGFKE
jgi:hypothetical protein